MICSLINSQGGWVSLLEGRLERDYPGVFQVVNLGINGDTVLGVEDRLIEALDRYPASAPDLGDRD
jgi:lysophospholipase L1-like esterase